MSYECEKEERNKPASRAKVILVFRVRKSKQGGCGIGGEIKEKGRQKKENLWKKNGTKRGGGKFPPGGKGIKKVKDIGKLKKKH